jgi:hypothetical protein
VRHIGMSVGSSHGRRQLLPPAPTNGQSTQRHSPASKTVTLELALHNVWDRASASHRDTRNVRWVPPPNGEAFADGVDGVRVNQAHCDSRHRRRKKRCCVPTEAPYSRT